MHARELLNSKIAHVNRRSRISLCCAQMHRASKDWDGQTWGSRHGEQTDAHVH